MALTCSVQTHYSVSIAGAAGTWRIPSSAITLVEGQGDDQQDRTFVQLNGRERTLAYMLGSAAGYDLTGFKNIQVNASAGFENMKMFRNIAQADELQRTDADTPEACDLFAAVEVVEGCEAAEPAPPPVTEEPLVLEQGDHHGEIVDVILDLGATPLDANVASLPANSFHGCPM